MYVTIDRAAIESTICNEYPLVNRSSWVTAVCRYGTLVVCDEWDDAQDAIMAYVGTAADEDEEECMLAECSIRPATDEEVMDTLLANEIERMAYEAARDINYPEEFKDEFARKLAELGYPEDKFLAVDNAPYIYYKGTAQFKVTPQF